MSVRKAAWITRRRTLLHEIFDTSHQHSLFHYGEAASGQDIRNRKELCKDSESIYGLHKCIDNPTFVLYHDSPNGPKPFDLQMFL